MLDGRDGGVHADHPNEICLQQREDLVPPLDFLGRFAAEQGVVRALIEEADRGRGRIVKGIEDQLCVLCALTLVARVGEHTEGGFAAPKPPVTAAVDEAARGYAVQACVEIPLLPRRVRSPL